MSVKLQVLNIPAVSTEVVATTTAKDYSAKPAIGIIATSTANFVFQCVGDTVNRTIPVIAGTRYDLQVDTIDVTSAATVLALFNS